MNIKTFHVNPLDENCYVVSDETKQCVIIDCGAYTTDEQNEIIDYIKSEELTPVALLATHGHLDHNFGIDAISTGKIPQKLARIGLEWIEYK